MPPPDRPGPRAGQRATGRRGAVASAHPLASRAAVRVLDHGGTAVDAAITAQAVICVLQPEAAGLGGDVLALVHDGTTVQAVNGTGCSPAALSGTPPTSGGGSVTVPGLVDGWTTLHERWGRLPMREVLAPAVRLASEPRPVDPALARAVQEQRGRLEAGGAGGWELLEAVRRGAAGRWRQPALADLLAQVAEDGRTAFYDGWCAAAVAAAARRHGGCLVREDLQGHETPRPDPVSVPWAGGRLDVQPPASQGVLLAMAAQHCSRLLEDGIPLSDHVLVELTEAAFGHRSRCGLGAALLAERLEVDLDRASRRGGPRAYLHTAGVATVDAAGMVVSSLVSVFDDFGSGVFVPEAGLVLNNRAAGFTEGPNRPRPSARPVHTLAPAMVTTPSGVAALATPGADGQVQTLLQVLARVHVDGWPLTAAVAGPRWRSQDGDLLVEEGHPGADELVRRGHRVVTTPAGAGVFGSVVAAGAVGAVGSEGSAGMATAWAVADWRRGASAVATDGAAGTAGAP